MGTNFPLNSYKWRENRRKQEGLKLFDRSGRHKENPQPYRNDWGIETLSSGRRLLQEIEDLFNRKIDAIYEKSTLYRGLFASKIFMRSSKRSYW